MYFSYHYDLYCVEISFFQPDPMDFEVHAWEEAAFKIIIALFSLRVVLISLEITRDRASVGLLNCYLSVFWGG